MVSETSSGNNPSFFERLKKRRRKFIKQNGKKLIRNLSDFIGRQGLVEDKPVLNLADFPDVQPLIDNWKPIRKELDEILKHREAIPNFQEVSPDQMRISKGNNWRTFILYGFGTKLEKNCSQAPITSELLEKVPNLQTAWFSILGPNYHIPAHRGVTKSILRCHVGLKIPKKAEDCYLRVDDEICVWREGEGFVFDDTYEHEVYNNTDEERVILLFDFNRPMKLWGRIINSIFVQAIKLSAYYQEPKKNMQTFEERFEAITRRADENMEKMGD